MAVNIAVLVVKISEVMFCGLGLFVAGSALGS